MVQRDPDLQKINKLIKIMEDNGLAEIEIKHGDDKILLKRFHPQQPIVSDTAGIVLPSGILRKNSVSVPAEAAQNSTAQIPTAAREDLAQITSPLVGTFYITPSPDAEPYVEVGSHVEPQTVVCIIEAMKVMNEIKAETSGTITEILVTNGQAVEYGQVIFKVKPD
jgi:acetyl-CoA carboxylase biotin carboxyl carrier protein